MTDTSHQMNQDRENLPERVELARRERAPAAEGTLATDVILVYLPHNKATPFVTWTETPCNASTFWGRYHRDLRAALEDFETR